MDFSELDDLDLPPLLPGEQVPDHRLIGEIEFYDPFGFPLAGDLSEQARQFHELRFGGGQQVNHFSTGLWLADTPLEVSTVYLGLDHNWSAAGPPLVWETMIFGHLGRDGQFCRRYTTRGAAQLAHQLIVERLLAMGLILADGQLWTE